MSLEVHFSGFTQQNAVSLEEPFSLLLLFLQPEQQPPQLTPPQLCNKTRTFPLMMISSVVDLMGCRSDIGNCIHMEFIKLRCLLGWQPFCFMYFVPFYNDFQCSEEVIKQFSYASWPRLDQLTFFPHHDWTLVFLFLAC